MKYQRCPVCDGRGVVQKGFYSYSINSSSSDTIPDKCKTCNSKGIILEPPYDMSAKCLS